MPELPEVETVRSGLAPRLRGRTIVAVRFLRPYVAGCTPEEFADAVTDRQVVDLVRRGKYLILRLGPRGSLPPVEVVVHLMMAGRLSYLPPGAGPPADAVEAKHTHAAFTLDDGSELRWADLRHFGRMRLVPADRPELYPSGLARLGPEPLEPDFTPDYLASVLLSRKASIKQVLLDQRALAGVGNIYADECLHRAGLHPLRRACSLQPHEVASLHEALRVTLQAAIAHRGTTSHTYVDGEGRPGSFQHRLRVYGREAQACLRPGCRGVIARLVHGGRSSHFCPECQPARTSVRLEAEAMVK